jgi:hypothetical protein
MTCQSSKMEHLLFYFAVEDFLDQKFPQKWTGRGRPTTQPPSFSSPYTILLLLLLGVRKSCILCSDIMHSYAGTCCKDTNWWSYSYTCHA